MVIIKICSIADLIFLLCQNVNYSCLSHENTSLRDFSKLILKFFSYQVSWCYHLATLSKLLLVLLLALSIIVKKYLILNLKYSTRPPIESFVSPFLCPPKAT